jgi:hypothetical protein
MCVADGQSTGGKLKEHNLPFEGFLEAICRLATLKALPTSAEVDESGAPDAGIYMARFKIDDEEAYDQMLIDRAGSWGSLPAFQPADRCVYHMVNIMIRRIEDSDDAVAETKSDLIITSKEFLRWAKANMKEAM